MSNMKVFRVLFLSACLLVLCQAGKGKNRKQKIIREEREVRLRRRGAVIAEERSARSAHSEEPSGEPASGGPSGEPASRGPSGGSSYPEPSDWIFSLASEAGSSQVAPSGDPLEESTFENVAHQIGDIFKGIFAKENWKAKRLEERDLHF